MNIENSISVVNNFFLKENFDLFLNKITAKINIGDNYIILFSIIIIGIFMALGCSGIARFDFLYNKETKEFFANEINPMPGTLYHHLWQKSGVELSDLVKRLIACAEEKHAEKNKTVFSFTTQVLSNLKNSKLKFNK